MKNTVLLMRKNLKEDFRRPKGFTCELLCPILVFLLFALMRTLIEKEEIPINYADGLHQKTFVEYDYNFINNTYRAYQDIARIICQKPQFRSRDVDYPASYLAIVPPPSANNNVKYIIDQMQYYWNRSKSLWNPEICDNVFVASSTFPSCSVQCRYEETEFTEGSILRYFNSETELESYLKSNKYARTTWDPTDPNDDGTRPIGFAIVFNKYDDWNEMTYTLRGNASFFPSTDGPKVDLFTKDFNTLFFAGYDKYRKHGMVQIQNWLNQIITEKIAIENGVDKPSFQYGIFAMPTGGYLTDDFYVVLQGMLPFMMILAFIYPYFVVSGAVVSEKASKIKEGLIMMGASATQYWLSIYCYYGTKFITIAFGCTLISWGTNIFQFSNFWIIFIWFTLFLFTLLTSAVMFSTFFDNPKTASMVSSILLLTLYFLSGIAPSLSEESQKTWLCLSGPACFAMSANNFGKYEEGLIGLKWNNLDQPYQDFRFTTALVMMLFDCILYTILAMYLDKVIPSKYGQHLPPYFIFQKSFWFPNAGYKVNQNTSEIAPILTSKRYETIDTQAKRSIEIRNLNKTFSTGLNSEPVIAVNGITLDIYEDEIFCLLGHNGAGKTTTLSMLTGMLTITSGTATIDGKDVATEMTQIRESLGCCPQHDVLWNTLTVEEHLRLFANLKGVEKSEVEEEVGKMIDGVKMQDKRNKYPTQLSGGQKRKLSLGIALIGGSKIVFLDEPTSGMDPHSRRDAWELIKQCSKGRTIILTTHFMDEADILSDRIAIMSQGQIECCGSSLFLKRLYGVGYSFTISVNTNTNIKNVSSNIDKIVMNSVSTAELLSIHGSELIYRLPFESNKLFPNMFRLIDSKKVELNIDSYGVSVTTLEEVFIKVGHGHQRISLDQSNIQMEHFQKKLKERRNSSDPIIFKDKVAVDDNNNDDNNNDDNNNDTEIELVAINNNNNNNDNSIDSSEEELERRRRRLSAEMEEIRVRSLKNLFFIHVYAMLYKKWNHTKRDKKAVCCQIILPILFMIFGFSLINLEPPSHYPKLPLDITQFDDSQFVYPDKIPYNSQSISSISINPFPFLYSNMTPSEKYGSLLPLNGGNNGNAYEYNFTTQQSLHTYFDSILSISDNEPFKYLSYYFPIYNTSIPCFDCETGSYLIDPSRHVGCGANISSFHSLPISINIASNLALKQISTNAKINAYIEPLPTTKRQTETAKMVESFIYSTYLSFGFAFFPVGIMYAIVYEKENLSKLQLLISGMNSIAYWLGNYLFDIFTILPSCIASIILIFIFDAQSFKGNALFPFVLVVLFYGISIVPFTYLFSWLFKSSTKAQYISLVSFIFLGYGFSLVTYIMDLFESTRDYSEIIKDIVIFSPSYCAAASLLNLATRDIPIAGLWDINDPPLHWNITGKLITFMAGESIVYFIFTIIIQYISTSSIGFNHLMNQQQKKEDTNIEELGDEDALNEQDIEEELNEQDIEEELGDEDVLNEQNKLKQHINNENGQFMFENDCKKDTIILTGLRKVYSGGIVAVKNLWFSIPCGQIFGFLGVNGAGKTTTLSMLCGKFLSSSGTAYINRIPITNQIACRRMIGYCPQFDAIFDLLTAKEHLYVYGLIKGIENEIEINKQSMELINSLNLIKYANKKAGTYSGGNKRKLSVAMAMIGQPPIVFLDEPSTGMDPVSRRQMWDFISQNMNNKSVILTTHSMEECQALCHRIGIMVKGQLTCLNTSQGLKERYGNGFQLDCNIHREKQIQLTNQLNHQFNNPNNNTSIEILEKHQENIKYKINSKLSLADMFEKLEIIHQNIHIDGGYALSQTSLEQIFLQMANQYQHNNHDDDDDQ